MPRHLYQRISARVLNLPPLHRELLDYLAAQADEVGLRFPKYGWAVTAVADVAASHLPDAPFLHIASHAC